MPREEGVGWGEWFYPLTEGGDSCSSHFLGGRGQTCKNLVVLLPALQDIYWDKFLRISFEMRLFLENFVPLTRKYRKTNDCDCYFNPKKYIWIQMLRKFKFIYDFVAKLQNYVLLLKKLNIKLNACEHVCRSGGCRRRVAPCFLLWDNKTHLMSYSLAYKLWIYQMSAVGGHPVTN